MGLDITAFSMLKRIDNPRDDQGIRLMDNTDFAGRAAPFTDGRYDYSEGQDVLIMSYGAYNRWREWLAKIAGYPPVRRRELPEPSHAAGCWAMTHGPFWELINFADNEGTIGTVACKKLLEDFASFDEKAKGDSDSGHYDTYVDVHEGLKIAVKGGALKFS